MSKTEIQETKDKVDLRKEVGTKIKTWLPDQKEVADFKQKISQAYSNPKNRVYDSKNKPRKPKLPDQFLEQYANIYVFLNKAKDIIIEHLINLNDLLVAESKLSKSKVLRIVLERELSVFGFEPYMGKVHEFLEPSLFRETLRKGLILKDPALRSTLHGDFTHAIQWLMIAWQHRANHFLGGSEEEIDRTVVNIYKSLGQDSAVISSKPQTIVGLPNRENTIWSELVDLPTPKTYSTLRPLRGNNWENDPTGFCSPDNLNVFLFKNEIPKLSFLKTLILKRENKRAYESKENYYRQAQLDNKEFRHPKNSYYFFHSPFPIQLPTALLQNEQSSLKELTLKVDTINEENNQSLPIENKNYSEIFSKASKSFDSKNYAKAIDLFLEIEKIYTQKHPESVTLQSMFYQLGVSYKRTQNIKLADQYFRKAFQVTLAIEKNESPQDLIPLSKIMKELTIVQHISRIKFEVEKMETEEVEEPASCIIC